MGNVKSKIRAYFSEIWADKKNKRLTLILYIVLPILINIIVESFNQRSFLKALGMLFTSFDTFIINTLIIASLLSLSLIFRKRITVIIFISVLWITMGVANFIVKSNRETPLSFSDLQDFSSVISVFDKYMSTFQICLVIFLAILFLVIVFFLWRKLPKFADKINYIRSIIIIAVVWGLMLLSVKIGLALGSVSYKFPNMSIAYQDYGFTYCFSISFVVRGVEQPEGYSNEDITEIIEKLESTSTVDSDNVQTPNIIFLQLESFIDLNNVIGLELNHQATPNFTSLKEEFTSGYLSVNNVGYGTANTEFEIMTGMNLEDFGPGEFPYKTILQTTTCESISYILREYGYMTHAMHNNTGSFYSRNTVFKNLGYDTYTSIEYMNPTEYTPTGWVKDSILTDEIIKVLDSTDEPDYLYTISVQGHGAYPSYEVLEDPYIQILSGIDDDERYNQITYYANQIYEMDEFIGELINALNNYDEEVILVMYGDHLPSLGLTEENLINENLYQTEYVIWSNYGFSLEDKDIETFQLASRIFQALNIDGGIINKFHQVYQNEDDYLSALKRLEFDMLYANMYVFEGVSPYVATDMQMGTYPIKITDVVIEDTENPVERPKVDYSDDSESVLDLITGGDDSETDESEEVEEGWIIVSGEHFSFYSHVFVNDEICDTIYIDENTLLAYAPEIKSLDGVVVKQMWKSKTVISETEEFMYIEVGNENEAENVDENN